MVVLYRSILLNCDIVFNLNVSHVLIISTLMHNHFFSFFIPAHKGNQESQKWQRTGNFKHECMHAYLSSFIYKLHLWTKQVLH